MSKFEKLNEKVWDFFSSVDLAVSLFIVISISAAVGTIIPQQPEPEITVRFFSKIMSEENAIKIYEVINLLDLNNLYHSWWFTFLLFMFALNLIVCSLDRLPVLIKSFKSQPQPLPISIIEKMPIKREIKFNEKSDFKNKVIDILKKKGFQTDIFQTSEALQIQAKKWIKTRLAIYVTHLSILIILAGALIGTFWGFRGHMNIVEGTGTDFAISDDGKAIPLGFKVFCDRFEVDYYENSAVPKAYRSYLRIIENENPVKFNGKETVLIEVNHPLSYKGITFYQASYGFQPQENAEFRFTYFDKNGKSFPLKAKFEEKFKLPGQTVSVSVIDFSPALGIDEQGRLFNMTTDMINPAVLLLFEDKGKKENQWILKKIPETWNTPYGRIRFDELWGAQYTGIQVRKDPGVPLIYAGSILMCIGLFVSLFLRPINYFVTIKNNTICFYAPSSKGKVMTEKKLEEIISELKGEVS
ncbi:cytochrome c biogenesis protein ResB [Thermodesulfovibrio sp.]|uniref:cytochrome c biogenesis protein ResB n=1 Tax=Thermodesulfovibrio sp. TaxID=2067987 RepID=UPI0030A72DEE